MAGGVFTQMNKRLPGAYINVKGLRSNIMAQAGERGTVFTIFSDLNWGGRWSC